MPTTSNRLRSFQSYALLWKMVEHCACRVTKNTEIKDVGKVSKVLVTGAHGLVGSECVRRYCEQGFRVVGIDNDFRSHMFGAEASTHHIGRQLFESYPNYTPYEFDIRDRAKVEDLYKTHGAQDLILHCAAAPAHEWAQAHALDDFEINALGTMNMLELFRQHSPDAVFVQVSTSKVYGDHVNELPFVEMPTRFDLPLDHPFYAGVDESMSIEGCLHSLFGASKAAGDLMAQEYGRYLGLKVGIFRPVCITGKNHQGAPLHGYLAYLVKCIADGTLYTVNGYDGKQVRDNIHAFDLVAAFDEVFKNPDAMKNDIGTYGEVFNMGAGRASNNSIREAIAWAEYYFSTHGGSMPHPFWRGNVAYSDENRRGDHKWCIFSTAKFRSRYPDWRITYDNARLMTELCDANLASISK